MEILAHLQEQKKKPWLAEVKQILSSHSLFHSKCITWTNRIMYPLYLENNPSVQDLKFAEMCSLRSLTSWITPLHYPLSIIVGCWPPNSVKKKNPEANAAELLTVMKSEKLQIWPLTRYFNQFYSNYCILCFKLLPDLYPPSTSGTVVEKLKPEFTLQSADLWAENSFSRETKANAN